MKNSKNVPTSSWLSCRCEKLLVSLGNILSQYFGRYAEFVTMFFSLLYQQWQGSKPCFLSGTSATLSADRDLLSCPLHLCFPGRKLPVSSLNPCKPHCDPIIFISIMLNHAGSLPCSIYCLQQGKYHKVAQQSELWGYLKNRIKITLCHKTLQ